MKQGRKIYDAAFKIKAVELSNNRSNLSELARELGIKVSLLYKWRKDYQEYDEGSFSWQRKCKTYSRARTYSRIGKKTQRRRIRT